MTQELTFVDDLRTIKGPAGEAQVTRKQYQIAKLLYRQSGNVVSWDRLYDHLYPDALDPPEPHILKVYLCYVRKALNKIGAEVKIKNIIGEGIVWMRAA